ncbi:MAG: SO_0444 family Cu/Zn efflux transporter [Planctomycetota bacterium]
MELVETFARVLAQLAPYLLLGFLVAGLLHALVPGHVLGRWLGGHGAGPIVRGALAGIPLPLCSCGVIPVAVQLRRQGASRGAMTSFLVATPETGVDSIAASFAVLHPLMVVFRPLAALVTAIGAGFAVEALTADPDRAPSTDAGGDGTDHACCHDDDALQQGPRGLLGGMRYAFDDLFGEIAIYLIPAIVITAALTVWIDVPARVAEALPSPTLQMLLMLVMSVPVYVCAAAATPVASALIAGGFAPGAALVFLLAGPATNLVTVAAVGRTLGTKAAVVYVTTVAIASFACGGLLQLLYEAWSIAPNAEAEPMHEHAGWLHWASAAVVGLLVIGHLVRKLHRRIRRIAR